jgi:mannosyltransferase
VLVLLGYPTQRLIRLPSGHSHDTEAAAAVITANERPGDAVAYALHESPEPWEARDLVARYVPAGKRPLDVFAVRPQRTDGHLLATECADPAACLALADPARLWVVRFQTQSDPLYDIGQPKEDLLRARYRLDRIWLVRGLTVACYLSASPAG